MKKNIRPPSIVDVARVSGVGVTTVSRVINKSGIVSKEKEKAVYQAIERLCYFPPPLSRRRGRPHGKVSVSNKAISITLIIIAEYGLNWVLQNAPVYASVFHGIESAIADCSGEVTVKQASDWEGVLKALQQTRSEGCLFLGNEPTGPLPSIVERIPSVWVMGSPIYFKGDHVQPDHFQAGIMAADYFLKKGHRNAAYIGSSISPYYHVSYRGLGFQMGMQHGGASVQMLVHPDIIISTPHQHSGNEEVLSQLVDQLANSNPRPTALFVQADMITPHLYPLLSQRGIKPQIDIELITCNKENTYLSFLKPQPVVLDLEAERIGCRAVDQIRWRLENPDQPSMRVMIQPKILI